VTLSASTGLESGSIAKWFTWPSRFFSGGPTVAETVYDGGLRSAQTAEARAAYDASVAAYRQTAAGRVSGRRGQPGRAPHSRARSAPAG
jgi:outer membrane protein TolC